MTKQQLKQTEAFFDKNAKLGMVSYELEGFKRTYPTLFNVIVAAMQEYAEEVSPPAQAEAFLKNFIQNCETSKRLDSVQTVYFCNWAKSILGLEITKLPGNDEIAGFRFELPKEQIEYKGYYTNMFFSEEDKVFYGKIIHVSDLVSFEGRTEEEFKDAFERAVDDYIAIKKRASL